MNSYYIWWIIKPNVSTIVNVLFYHMRMRQCQHPKAWDTCSGFTERDKNMCVRNSHTAVFGVHDTHWNEHGYVERKPWNLNTKPGALIHFHVSSESSILVSSSLLWPKIPIPSASRWNHGSDRSTPFVGDGWCVETIYCIHTYIYIT